MACYIIVDLFAGIFTLFCQLPSVSRCILMGQREITEKNRAWLSAEIPVWQEQGIISPVHAARIWELYVTAAQSAERRRNWARFALLTLATLMMGLAVLLVIGYNWQDLGRPLKLSVIFGSILGAHGAGLYLRRLPRTRSASELFFFLGCLCYGAAIWLIAQIFNINSHYPDGVWYWALGVLPFALCLDTPLFHCLYAGLLAAWVGCETLGFSHPLDLVFAPWRLPLPATCSLPLMVLPGLVWAYRKKSPLTSAIYLAVVAWWVVLYALSWEVHFDPMCWLVALGGIFSLIALAHLPGNKMARPFQVLGAAMILAGLVPRSFAEYQCLYRSDLNAKGLGIYVGIFFILAGLISAMCLAYRTKRAQIGQNGTPSSIASSLAHLAVPLTVVFAMGLLAIWHGLMYAYDVSYRSYYAYSQWTYPALVPVVIVNVLMVAFALWLMAVGMKNDRVGVFASGVAYFLLWAIVRYFDLFSGIAGMLGAAVLFLICGILLYVVARLWQHRKEISHV
jgi:uncharacterized membrane protein